MEKQKKAKMTLEFPYEEPFVITSDLLNLKKLLMDECQKRNNSSPCSVKIETLTQDKYEKV